LRGATDRDLVTRWSKVDPQRAHCAFGAVPQDDRSGCEKHTESDGEKDIFLDPGDAPADTEPRRDSQNHKTPARGTEAPSRACDQQGENSYGQAYSDIHLAPPGVVIGRVTPSSSACSGSYRHGNGADDLSDDR
jgi:hypothetical protein